MSFGLTPRRGTITSGTGGSITRVATGGGATPVVPINAAPNRIPPTAQHPLPHQPRNQQNSIWGALNQRQYRYVV